MKRIKISLFLAILLSLSIVGAITINSGDKFSIEVPNSTFHIYSNSLDVKGYFYIINNLDEEQYITIKPQKVSGWDIILSKNKILLKPKEKQKINFEFKANKDFNYRLDIISDNFIKISNKNIYLGTYRFPFDIKGENSSIKIFFDVFVDKETKPPIDFNILIEDKAVTPGNKIKIIIEGKNINKTISSKLRVTLDNLTYNYKLTFNSKEYIRSIDVPVPTLQPGVYNLNIDIVMPRGQVSQLEWKFKEQINILPLNYLVVKKAENENFLREQIIYNITNKGNINSFFKTEIPINILQKLILKTNLESNEYTIENSTLKINKNIPYNTSEEITIIYRYWIIYLVIMTIIILIIIHYIHTNSNPLEVRNKIYGVVKDINEGVKKLKVKIEFENKKERELEEVSIIFRMPKYLAIKQGSFTLVEPNQVLKSRNEYKMIWKFKRFEKGESRIIGFTLINNKGILGDIRLPDLEIQVKKDGKVKRYYKSFPIIKG